MMRWVRGVRCSGATSFARCSSAVSPFYSRSTRRSSLSLRSHFSAGCAGAIFGPARGAIVPALLTREKLAAGNSLVYASDRAVEIGARLLAGR